MKVFARRAVCAGSIIGALALAGSGLASAHVSVSAPGATQGGYEVLTFRVPTESDTAGTTALTVTLPGLRSARTEPMPGWHSAVTKDPGSALATSVTWTADPGVEVGPGQFGEFRVSAGPLPDAASVDFPATQTYSDGAVVEWDQQPAPDGTEPEHPVPSLTLEPASAQGGHAHGGQSGSAATDAESGGSTASDSDSGDDAVARWLGGAGLVLGALALALAIGNTIRRRS
ncbi:YcnI family protein [Tomitella fengzijianii]|uniref:YcnI family protein n=1 Tax=Tomitella fengzijianii TaxID=2597660 RepID=A0A516WZS7_9ACTN|nr:YcnI family protein [Tomitella fengzijianii]QDQ96315.1 YcnI family protein [Tomitella fengzijianii]